MKANSKVLWSDPWIGVVDPELSKVLVELAVRRTLVDGEPLYRRGERSSDLVGVQSGLIRVEAVSGNGQVGLLGLYRPGTWFGEVSFFDKRPRPVDTYAVGVTEVMILPADKLLPILDRNPIWYRDFARVLCHKLRMALAYIESTAQPIAVRLSLRLLDFAEAYGKPTESGLLLDLKLSQEDLAHTVGLTRQSVNKELQILQAMDILVVKKNQITIRSIDGLRRRVADGGGATLVP